MYCEICEAKLSRASFLENALNMEASSFARSVVAVQTFLNKILDGVDDEFLAWPVEVMSDWASSCSLFRQSVNFLSTQLANSPDAQTPFRTGTQETLRKVWELTEVSAREFSNIRGDIHARIGCADKAKRHLLEAKQQLTVVTKAALSALDLDESGTDLLSPALLRKVFPINEPAGTEQQPCPQWDRFLGFFGELEFAIRYSDRLRICMLTRQMMMHWLHNSVDPEIFALAAPMTHQLCSVNRQALWRLERPARLEDLDEDSFLSESIEGQAVLKRYRFFRSVLDASLNSDATAVDSRIAMAAN